MMKTSLILLLCALTTFCVAEKLQASSEEVSGGDEEDVDLTGETAEIVGLCGLCKRGLNMVKKHLTKNSTTEMIKEKVNKMCDKLPVGKSACKKFVHRKLSVLVERLKAGDDVRAICVKVKACKKKPQLEEAEDQRMERDLGMDLDEYA